jgi:transposase
VVVDEFKTPDNQKLNVRGKQARYYNHYNRNHAMSLFTLTLRHMVIKYGGNYTVAPLFTTRTCSNCYHVNQPLLLSDRNLHCEKCGTVIDRDANAAMNCYDSFNHPLRWTFA